MFGLGAVSFGDTPGEIAWEAHLGGFAAGFLRFGVIDRFGRPPWPPELR
jgi:membrane associated rhomboid family serine protease